MNFSFRRVFGTLLLSLVLVFCCSIAFAGHHGEKSESKKGILLVAFGSSMTETQGSFTNIETLVKKAFPKVPVRWAWSSAIIREKVAKEQGKIIASPAEALAQMMAEGFTDVAVQSLHTIPGEEYEGIKETAESFEGMPKGISHISIGKPLLYSNDDMKVTTAALLKAAATERKADEALVLMGHGTHHYGNIYYPALQYFMDLQDGKTFVGTVEGAPSLDDVKARLEKMGAKKVWLMPFMSVAGDHARNDMAGPEADSWKSELTKDGYDCGVILKGTAEFDAIANIWVDHLKEAWKALD
ncbi:MAG: sirohydrochlorin cobaltochelatase [Desulfovibrio sp.]